MSAGINHTEIIDELEAKMLSTPQVECPVIHIFTPGLYLREMNVPRGTLLTSKIHKTEHPFILSKGTVRIWLDGDVFAISAPYCGITKPGTRRIIYAIEDSTWTTMHSNPDNENEIEIEERIIEKHDNIFIGRSKEMEELWHL